MESGHANNRSQLLNFALPCPVVGVATAILSLTLGGCVLTGIDSQQPVALDPAPQTTSTVLTSGSRPVALVSNDRTFRRPRAVRADDSAPAVIRKRDDWPAVEQNFMPAFQRPLSGTASQRDGRVTSQPSERRARATAFRHPATEYSKFVAPATGPDRWPQTDFRRPLISSQQNKAHHPVLDSNPAGAAIESPIIQASHEESDTGIDIANEQHVGRVVGPIVSAPVFLPGERRASAPAEETARQQAPPGPSAPTVAGPSQLETDTRPSPTNELKIAPEYQFLFTDPAAEPVPGVDPNLREVPVTLRDALVHALDENPEIIVERLRAPVLEEQIRIEKAIFDPVFKVGGYWSRLDRQVTNAVDAQGLTAGALNTDTFSTPPGTSEQVSVSKQLESGATVEAGWITDYQFNQPAGGFLALNPSYQSAMNLRIEQPLFQGFGSEINNLPIRVARASHRSSLHQVHAAVNQLLLDTEVAYWALYGAWARVQSSRQAAREARTAWQMEIRKIELGASSIPEIAQAREQYERFRRELAFARRTYAVAETKLRLQLGMPGHDGTRLVPQTEPVSEFQYLDWDNSIQEAYSNRPEVHAQQELIRAAHLTERRFGDRLNPDVRAVAGYSLSGAGNEFHESARTVFNNRYQSWNMGVLYEYPLYRRRQHAERDQAEITLIRERAKLDSIENRIEHELREAWNNVMLTRQEFQSLQTGLDAARVQVSASRVLYEEGQLSLDLFLRAQSAYARAVQRRQDAFVEYTQALAAWEFSKGTLRFKSGIYLTD